jgi:predicted DCC family thiol-disulfide oxidoreductase YuxK
MRSESGSSQPALRRPVLIYDGDCGFCRGSVQRGASITGPAVEYLAQQARECRERFPELDPEALKESVHLVEPDGRVSRGAEAVFRALGVNPRWGWAVRAYERHPLLAGFLEWSYALVARHRTLFSWLTRPFLRG